MNQQRSLSYLYLCESESCLNNNYWEPIYQDDVTDNNIVDKISLPRLRFSKTDNENNQTETSHYF